jgi:hypothetical protein
MDLEVSFNKNSSSIKFKDGSLFSKLTRINSQYQILKTDLNTHLKNAESKMTAALNASKESDKLSVFHQRFSHLHEAALRILITSNVVPVNGIEQINLKIATFPTFPPVI